MWSMKGAAAECNEERRQPVTLGLPWNLGVRSNVFYEPVSLLQEWVAS